jgi:3-oxoacyl-[acyl-carrier-protein] synthase-3
MSISALQLVIPSNSKTFMEEMDAFKFPKERSMKLAEVMGFEKHHLVEQGVSSSDLAVYGLQKMFDSGKLKKDSIHAMVVVTQSPDHFLPGTSSVIHGKLGLSEDVYCLDLNQGCAGYIVGLIEAFRLLENESIKKVVLINVDVLSKAVSKQDRNSYPLIGDGAAITVLERSAESTQSCIVKFDGVRREALIIPAGAFSEPSNVTTSELLEDANGNLRSREHLYMDGSQVFNFVQVEVPKLIEELLDLAGKTIKEISAFVFHQPNKFMIEKLSQKMGIDQNKMPGNIVTHFGNSSGVTIPLNLAFNFRKELLKESNLYCLAGFGVGLTWGGIVMEIGAIDYCEIDFY